MWDSATFTQINKYFKSICFDCEELPVFREKEIAVEYLQRLRNGIYNNQPSDKIPLPYSLTCTLVTSYILCLYSWGNCKRLFDIFTRNCSSCHHKNISKSGSPIIWTTCKSASEYPTTSRILDRRDVNIKFLVPFKYLSTFFAVV